MKSNVIVEAPGNHELYETFPVIRQDDINNISSINQSNIVIISELDDDDVDESITPLQSEDDQLTLTDDEDVDESIPLLQPEDAQLTLTNASWHIFHHSLKLIGCRLLYVSGIVGSFAILGHKDKNYLAASGFLNTSQITLMYTATGPINIVGIDIKGALTQHRDTDVGILYRQGLKMVVLLGIPTSLASLGIAPLFRVLGQSPAVVEVIRDYNWFFSAAIPGNMLFLNNMQLLMATKNYKLMGLQSGVFTALILSLGYLFINGALGFPKLNAGGLGLASLIAGWSGALITSVYLLLSNRYKPYRLCDTSTVNDAITLMDMLKRGFPISIQSAVETLYTVILGVLMGLISTEAASASAPIWSYAIFITPVTMSIAMQAALFIKEALTQRRFLDARQYGYASFLVGEIVPLINTILCYAIPRPMLSLFMDVNNPNNTEVVSMAEPFLQIASFALVADGIRVNAGGAARGYNDTAFSMATGVGVVLLLGSFMSSILDFTTSLGGSGLLLGRTLAFALAAFIMLIYWHRKSHVVTDDISFRAESSQGLWSNITSCLRYTVLGGCLRQQATIEELPSLADGSNERTTLIIQSP